MKKRSCVLGVIFTVLTAGLYGLYWFCCLTNDTNRLAKSKTAGGLTALIFTVITGGLYGFYWYYKLGVKVSEIKKDTGSSGIAYLLLYLFCLGFIAFLLAQSEVKCRCRTGTGGGARLLTVLSFRYTNRAGCPTGSRLCFSTPATTAPEWSARTAGWTAAYISRRFWNRRRIARRTAWWTRRWA